MRPFSCLKGLITKPWYSNWQRDHLEVVDSAGSTPAQGT